MLGNKQTSDLQICQETLKHLVERTMEYAKTYTPVFGKNSFMRINRPVLIITQKSLDSCHKALPRIFKEGPPNPPGSGNRMCTLNFLLLSFALVSFAHKQFGVLGTVHVYRALGEHTEVDPKPGASLVFLVMPPPAVPESSYVSRKRH